MKLLKELIETLGPSGNEETVRTLIAKEIRPCVDEIFVDKFGNLIAHKNGSLPKVMLAAHMDEIGLVIKNIDQKGRISCSAIGGVFGITLLGEMVHLKTKKGKIHGIITTGEMSDSKYIEKIPKIGSLIVDTGLTKEKLEDLGIGIGNYIYLEREYRYLGSDNYICGKALDDRIGCYIMIELARRLKRTENDIYYVFTVQEEVGLYGATTSAYQIEPDWAIVIDVTNADDFSSNPTKELGKGSHITIKDAGIIANRCINNWLMDIARKKKIPFQKNVENLGTTDALNISISKGGVPSTVIGVPIRNLHTLVGIAHRKDIENTIDLLEALLEKPPKVCLV